jgi:hypothetical protein
MTMTLTDLTESDQPDQLDDVCGCFFCQYAASARSTSTDASTDASTVPLDAGPAQADG